VALTEPGHVPAPVPGTVRTAGDPGAAPEASCACGETIRLSGMLNGMWLHTGRRAGE
jgi:hypothetical protein